MQPVPFVIPGQQLLAYSFLQGQTILASVVSTSHPPQSEALTSTMEWNKTEISAPILLMAMAFLFLLCCATIALLIIICCSYKRTDIDLSRRCSAQLSPDGIIDSVSIPEYKLETLQISPLFEDDGSRDKILIDKTKGETVSNGSPISQLNVVKFPAGGSQNNLSPERSIVKKESPDEAISGEENTYKMTCHVVDKMREHSSFNGNEINSRNLQNNLPPFYHKEQNNAKQFQNILKSFKKISQKTYEPLKNMDLELKFGRRASSKIPSHS